MNELTQEILKSILSYDETTGVFRWKIKPCNNVKIGGIAGGLNGKGYIQIHYKDKYYCAHRLAWMYVYGVEPPLEIDHINGISTDNRIANLRSVSHRVNEQNRSEHRGGQLPGACFHKGTRKWEAKISMDGKQKYLGLFKTEQEASAAYFRAVSKLEAVR